MVATVAELAPHAAASYGAREAVQFAAGRALTFGEIDELAGRLAAGLSARGVDRGDRVILHLPNSWQWIVAYHAIARLGAVCIPANILLSAEELAYIAEDSGARLAVLPAARRASLSSHVQTVIVDDDEASEFAALLTHAARAPAPLTPDDLSSLCYTSGTSGRPKGVMLTHGNIVASIAMTATVHVRTWYDRVYSALPFPHVYGNVVLNASFLTGNHLSASPRFDAGDALGAIDGGGITVFEGVPTMYYQMLAHPALDATDFSSLSRCTVGGQTMPLAKLDEVVRRFGCSVLELWGMTELAGPAITHSPYWPPRYGSIGLPFPGTDIRLADLDDAERDAPPGQPGELLVRGPLLTPGYWNDPAATAAAFGGGWFATGDVATRDADGYVTIVDRRKDMILCAGYNVYPAEVERVIAEHPAVAMVAVSGIADEAKGEIPVAHIVLRADASQTREGDIDRYCRERLATYKLPRRIHFAATLPVTSTGKIMRRMLRPS